MAANSDPSCELFSYLSMRKPGQEPGEQDNPVGPKIVVFKCHVSLLTGEAEKC